MTNKTKSLLCAMGALTAVMATGCGTDNLSSKNLETTRWVSDCGPQDTDKKEVAFQADSLTLTQTHYAAGGCQKELRSTTHTYLYKMGEEIGKTDIKTGVGQSEDKFPIKALDLTFQSVSVTFKQSIDDALPSLRNNRFRAALTPEGIESRNLSEMFTGGGKQTCGEMKLTAGQSIEVSNRSAITDTTESLKDCLIAFQDGFDTVFAKRTAPFHGYKDGDLEKPVKVKPGMTTFAAISFVERKNMSPILYFSDSYTSKQEERAHTLSTDTELRQVSK